VRKALVPGSFDPVHNGHLEIIERASGLFDEVLVAAIRNPGKGEALFSLEERREMLLESTAHLRNVSIDFFKGLLVDFARDHDCSAIVKGLRAVSDFETELQMAQMNKHLSGIDTVFIPTASKHSFLASRLLKEVSKYGGDISSMVPDSVYRRLKEKFAS
jgi:pantetheine-phosphate adenylyltransferase